MKTKIYTQHRFEHSFSREFGSPIIAENPDRRITSYGVRIGTETGDYDFDRIKIEHRTPGNTYSVLSGRGYIDTWLPFKTCESMQQAKKYISRCFEAATPEQHAAYFNFGV